jgi:hypothetical protein
VRAIWIPCLVVGVLLLALVAFSRHRAHLTMLEQKRRQERQDAHRFLQEVPLLAMCELLPSMHELPCFHCSRRCSNCRPSEVLRPALDQPK